MEVYIHIVAVKVSLSWVIKLGNAQEVVDGFEPLVFPNYIEAM